jgi:site-specific DNA-methyltransferase (cytosine-N4-specific)
VSIESLLAACRSRRIELTAADGKLRYRGPEGALTDELRVALTSRRSEVLAALATANASPTSPAAPPWDQARADAVLADVHARCNRALSGEANTQARRNVIETCRAVAVGHHAARDPVLWDELASLESLIAGWRKPGEPPPDALHQLRRREEVRCQEQPRHREGDLGTVPGDFHAAGARVDRADCLEWFAAQEADSVDLTFGSPPYEAARLYLEGGEDYGIARNPGDWVEWMVRVYLAALRCCKGLVAFVVEGQTRDYRWSAAPALLMAELVRAGVTLRKPPVYRRVGIPGSGGPDWLRNDYELIVCATRGGRLPWSDNKAMGHEPKYRPGGDPSHRTQDGTRVNDSAGKKDRSNVGPQRAGQRAGRVYEPPALANPGNVIECKAGGGNMGDKLCHENEAPFPESLAEFFVRSFCPPGGVVCDPFAGSGTTGAMAVKWGRQFVGCDLRESQVGLSRRRIAGVQRELFPGS